MHNWLLSSRCVNIGEERFRIHNKFSILTKYLKLFLGLICENKLFYQTYLIYLTP